ncbi:MAG: hypothetical protein ACN6NX_06870 [Acinetobacter sp.]
MKSGFRARAADAAFGQYPKPAKPMSCFFEISASPHAMLDLK